MLQKELILSTAKARDIHSVKKKKKKKQSDDPMGTQKITNERVKMILRIFECINSDLMNNKRSWEEKDIRYYVRVKDNFKTGQRSKKNIVRTIFCKWMTSHESHKVTRNSLIFFLSVACFYYSFIFPYGLWLWFYFFF